MAENGRKNRRPVRQGGHAVTAVEDIRINAIGNGRIQFQISYVGDLDTLAGALRSARLLLSETGGYFTLTDM